MAFTAEATGSELIIRVEDGMTATGATRYANLNYRSVKADATDNKTRPTEPSSGKICKIYYQYYRLGNMDNAIIEFTERD